jgi:hypothetical protein
MEQSQLSVLSILKCVKLQIPMGKIEVKDFTRKKLGKSFVEIKYIKMKKRCEKKLNIIILQGNTELSF